MAILLLVLMGRFSINTISNKGLKPLRRALIVLCQVKEQQSLNIPIELYARYLDRVIPLHSHQTATSQRHKIGVQNDLYISKVLILKRHINDT